MMTTLIQNCSLLDSSSPKGYIEHQDILICDHRIAAVQSTGAIANSDRVIDGQGLLALPGLINSHTHSPENILRATVEQLHLELWLVKQFAHRANFPLRLIYLITLAGTAEMIRSGTTAVLDHFWMAQSLTLEGLDAAMHAYAESGMRVGLAPLVEDQNLILEYAVRAEPRLALLEEDQENRAVSSDLLVLLQDFFERWHLKENGRLKCLPGPGGPQWCSRHLLQGCLELAQQFNTGFHLHLAETCLQSKVCLSIYGRPAILELEEMGILGPNTSIAHGVWISDGLLCGGGLQRGPLPQTRQRRGRRAGEGIQGDDGLRNPRGGARCLQRGRGRHRLRRVYGQRGAEDQRGPGGHG